jgi:peptidoglycan/LPS O-acetylase OafA/YrhL
MDSVRVRRWWRVWFYAVVAIVAPFTVPSALDIPDAERIAVISGWVVVALLYGALVWRTRRDGRDWRIQDALIILMFLLAALYQANWPDWRIPSNPALVGGVCAASALGSSIAQSRRWQPPERPAPRS